MVGLVPVGSPLILYSRTLSPTKCLSSDQGSFSVGHSRSHAAGGYFGKFKIMQKT